MLPVDALAIPGVSSSATIAIVARSIVTTPFLYHTVAEATTDLQALAARATPADIEAVGMDIAAATTEAIVPAAAVIEED